jgi:hypothetical protein
VVTYSRNASSISSESTRPSRQWISPVCWSPPASLCVDWTEMSAPASIADDGSSGWKCRCPPHASSTNSIAWLDVSWIAAAIACVFAHSPSYVGEV